MKMQKTQKIQSNLKKEKVGGLTLPDFKTSMKLQQTREHGSGIQIDKWITKQEKTEKNYIYTINWFQTKAPKRSSDK